MSLIEPRKPLSPSARRVVASAVLLCGAIGAAAQAQTVFRIVGPDGKVTFSDQPPAAAAAKAAAPASSLVAGGSNATSTGGRLPLELRKAVGQFPVVLYSGKDCGPCNSGRNLLINRGIPFTEKTVDNNESVLALKQLSGQSSIPMLTIGSQQLKGFSETSWSQYLTSAGYPAKSVLPANYARASAAPLAEAKQATPVNGNAPAAAAEQPAPAEPEVPVAPPSTGIRF